MGAGNRKYQENEDPLRNCFLVDRERIVLSKAFRRLKHKTQVFWAPRNDYFRTRLTHSLEVALVACTISRNLGLNVDLTEAIAFGHDLGHTPFGHAGERAMKKCLEPNGIQFEHNLQSLRVVTMTEDSHKELAGLPFPGLNLTDEVRDGIETHPFEWSKSPKTPEGFVVRYADIISYTNHDYLDFTYYKIPIPKQLSDKYGKLGDCYRRRIDKMIDSIINESKKAGTVQMPSNLSKLCKDIMRLTNKEIFEGNEEWVRREKGALNVISGLFKFFMEAQEDLLEGLVAKKLFSRKALDRIRKEGTRLKTIVDHISGMTDNYALEQYKRFISPETLEYYF